MPSAALRPLAAAATARVGPVKISPARKIPWSKHPRQRGGHGLPVHPDAAALQFQVLERSVQFCLLADGEDDGVRGQALGPGFIISGGKTAKVIEEVGAGHEFNTLHPAALGLHHLGGPLENEVNDFFFGPFGLYR